MSRARQEHFWKVASFLSYLYVERSQTNLHAPDPLWLPLPWTIIVCSKLHVCCITWLARACSISHKSSSLLHFLTSSHPHFFTSSLLHFLTSSLLHFLASSLRSLPLGLKLFHHFLLFIDEYLFSKMAQQRVFVDLTQDEDELAEGLDFTDDNLTQAIDAIDLTLDEEDDDLLGSESYCSCSNLINYDCSLLLP